MKTLLVTTALCGLGLAWGLDRYRWKRESERLRREIEQLEVAIEFDRMFREYEDQMAAMPSG